MDMAVDCITMCSGVMSSKYSRVAIEVVGKQFERVNEASLLSRDMHF